MPTWLRRLLWLLLLLLLLLVALVAWHEDRKPESLATSVLVGPRQVTGGVCVEEAVDLSGSMTAFTAERERAERELFDFAHRQLLPEDSFAEAFFADQAQVSVPPTALAQLRSTPGVPTGLGHATLLTPAVDGLVRSRPAGQDCAARALVIITDGLLGDDPAALAAALRRGSYDRVYAVVPVSPLRGLDRPRPLDAAQLRGIVVQEFHNGGLAGRVASVLSDAKPLDVTLGAIFAQLTGQTLARGDVPPPAPGPTPSPTRAPPREDRPS